MTKHAQQDSNECNETPEKVAIITEGGATGGALADTTLRRLVELWPTLSQETKQRIMAMAKGS